MFQASTCTARTRKNSSQRFLFRSLDQDLFEDVQARMRDPTFDQKRSERMWKSEGLFAEAKRNHCLARAKYRGRCKVQIQAYLSAIVQNLKRLVIAFYLWLVACWLRLTRAISQAQSTNRIKRKSVRQTSAKIDFFNTPVP